MKLLAGAAAAALGFALEEAFMRRERGRSDPAARDDFSLPADAVRHDVATDDGGTVHVVARGAGDGAPILLLHGVTLSSATWRYQLADLATGRRVVAVDHRGHGRSRRGEADYSIERLALDAGAVLEALDLRDAVLVGHSMGGMVAMELLADACPGADRVAALVLMATTASPGAEIPGFTSLVERAAPGQTRALRWAGRLPGGGLPSTDLSYLLTRLGLGRSPSPTHVELTRAMTAAVPTEVLVDLWQHVALFDARAHIDRIRVPTTVVAGTHDRLTPLRDAREIARRIPGARLVTLDGAGHMPMLERRAEVAALLREVADAVRAPASGTGSTSAAS